MNIPEAFARLEAERPNYLGTPLAARHRPALAGGRMLAVAVGLLGVLIPAAFASEASQIAERGGFLLGHSYRCGVPTARLQAPAQLVRDLMAAAATDADEKEAAAEAFSTRFLASWLTSAVDESRPSCARVRGGVAQLTAHRRPGAQPGAEVMSRKPEPPQSEPSARAMKPARSKRPASRRRELLSMQQRAELTLKLAAREQRGRPPSI